MKRILIILLLLVPLAASARLGETRAQCEQRYGDPVVILEDGAVIFRKDNVVITTYFDSSNRVEWIEYRAPDLSHLETEHFLQISSAEHWKALDYGRYHAEEARLTAMVSPHEFLRIYPDNWNEIKAARNKLLREGGRPLVYSQKIDLDGF